MIYIKKIWSRQENKFKQMKKLFDFGPQFWVESKIGFTENSSTIRLDIYAYTEKVNNHINDILDAFYYDGEGSEIIIFQDDILDLSKPLFFYEFENLWPKKYIVKESEFQFDEDYISYKILTDKNEKYGFLKINKENPNEINNDMNLFIVTNDNKLILT